MVPLERRPGASGQAGHPDIGACPPAGQARGRVAERVVVGLRHPQHVLAPARALVRLDCVLRPLLGLAQLAKPNQIGCDRFQHRLGPGQPLPALRPRFVRAAALQQRIERLAAQHASPGRCISRIARQLQPPFDVGAGEYGGRRGMLGADFQPVAQRLRPRQQRRSQPVAASPPVTHRASRRLQAGRTAAPCG